ncbi:MAG: DNA polymerase III subunit delta' [Candidatus Paceibacterota bacterium]
MILGHQKQWKFLKRSLEHGRVSHAYLFYGQQQLGKKTLALKFAKLLNCEADFEKRPCNSCKACNEIKKRRHPDLSIIEPDGGEIKIDQVRDLTELLSKKPYQGPYKIAVIDQAHLLNHEAESALLKTVEEPKGNTVLILVTSQKDSLAPTLISRTQSIEFYPVSRSKIQEFLEEDVDKERAKKIAEVSLGRPGLAKDLTDSDKFEQYQEKLEQLKKMVKSNYGERFDYIESLSKSDDLNYTLNLWVSQLRRILLQQITTGKNEFSYSLEKIKEALQEIQKTKRLINNTNVKKRLALETLMIKL